MMRFWIIFFISFLSLSLPYLIFAADGTEIKTFQTIPGLGGELTTRGYIQALFNLAIGVAAIIVVLRLILVGTKYILTESIIKKGDAKKEIGNALLGLVVILASVLLLKTINPNLVNLDFFKESRQPTIINPGPADRIGFMPGQIFPAAKIAELCRGTAGPLSFSVNAKCVRDNEIALERSCIHNGGRFDWRYDITFDYGGYSYYSYSCE